MSSDTPSEAWSAEALQERINSYPPYVGAEIRVTSFAEDASEVRIEMPLTDRNVNLVGTHFGGSLYAMVDPHLMILLKLRLGPDYVVWDQSAAIDFLRPGRGTVHATVRVTDTEIDEIRSATAQGAKYHPRWQLDIHDAEGQLVATVVKTLYVRRQEG
jgi:acyl-coenzyme A thioesterase PaaI-like protein